MHIFIRAQFLAASLFISSIQLHAGKNSGSPFIYHAVHLLGTILHLDSRFGPAAAAPLTNLKICSCQILRARSTNYDDQHIAVFAEKTDRGNLSRELSQAKAALAKEKKHLKAFFYDKVQVVARAEAPGNCKSLFEKLKRADQSLVMYDILDADQVVRQ